MRRPFRENRRLRAFTLRRPAFTLRELFRVIRVLKFVVTLMWLLAMVRIPRTSCSKITWDLRYLIEAAELFQVTTGSLPQSLEELESSKELPSGMIPCDPWGHPYRYEVRDGSPVAICLGRDGRAGGEGEDSDREWPASKE